MTGYVGTRAKKRRLRRYLIFIFIVIILIIIFFFNQSDEEVQQRIINQENFELQIIEKDQKILFRDKQIIELKNNMKTLVSKNNNLMKNIKLLEEKIKENSLIFQNKNSTQIEKMSIKLNQALNELNKIKKEKKDLIIKYENIEKKITEINSEKMSIKMQNNLLKEKIQSQEIIILDLEKTIKNLNDKIHH